MAKDYLPTYRNADGIKKTYQDRFYGYKHTEECGDGEIFDEQNMSSDHFPVMAPRQPRLYASPDGINIFEYAEPQGLNSEDGMFWIASGDLYYNGELFPTYNSVSDFDREQQIVWMGNKFITFPSKKVIDFSGYKQMISGGGYSGVTVTCDITHRSDADVVDPNNTTALTRFKPRDILQFSLTSNPSSYFYAYLEAIDTTDEYWIFPVNTFPETETAIQYSVSKMADIKNLEAIVGNLSCDIINSAPPGQPEDINKITANIEWDEYFKVGDAVTITGSSYTENNQTAIIRSIDHGSLLFDDNAFISEEENVTLELYRWVPDLDFVFQCDNRLWGCKGDTIYASKLGDPTNFNVFDGLASDSYAVNTGSPGDFTGACAYQGYPTFFKEDHIYKVYGTRPQNYQIQDTMTLGVEAGSHKSLAVAGETLYYKSRAGFVAYTGGIPRNISADLGEDVYKYFNAVAGSDGVKYYATVEWYTWATVDSVRRKTTHYILFTYDTRYGVWHKEDETAAFRFATEGQKLWCMTRYFYAADPEDVKYSNIMIVNNHDNEYENYPIPLIKESSSYDSMVLFGDFVAADANKKGISKIQFRCIVPYPDTFKMQIIYDKGGMPEEATPGEKEPYYEDLLDSETRSATVSATYKRSFYRALTPHRTDNYRLRIKATGSSWRLYSLSRDEYSGSELQKH